MKCWRSIGLEDTIRLVTEPEGGVHLSANAEWALSIGTWIAPLSSEQGGKLGSGDW